MKTDPTVEKLHEFLIAELGVPVRLTITDNRRTMISYRQEPDSLQIRLHRMFLEGNRRLWRTVVSFCRRPTKSNRAALDRFIKAHQEEIPDPEAATTRVLVFTPEGEHHDLADLLDHVNAKYFKRQCDAKVTWGRQSARRSRRGIQLGAYDVRNNVIRVHPALDAPWVPRYVVENLLYHEMLHWLFRPRQGTSRRVIHSKAFRDAEQSHPQHRRAQDWLETNLNRLLRR